MIRYAQNTYFDKRYGNDIIPDTYMENRAVLLARDPLNIFVLWEYDEKTQDHMYDTSGDWVQNVRVYDLINNDKKQLDIFEDHNLHKNARKTHIKVKHDGHKYMVEIGVIKHGNFLPLLESNIVKTPPLGVSNELDCNWLSINDLFKTKGINIDTLSSFATKELNIRASLGNGSGTSFDTEYNDRLR